jgi:hypothetical protein
LVNHNTLEQKLWKVDGKTGIKIAKGVSLLSYVLANVQETRDQFDYNGEFHFKLCGSI